MSHPSKQNSEYTLQELASRTQATLIGDPLWRITGVASLGSARPHEAAFLENPRYAGQLVSSAAGVVLLHPSVKQLPGKNYLVTTSPSLAFQILIELFLFTPLSGFSGIHPTAVIHSEAFLDREVVIGPYVVIERGARVGSRTLIGAGTFVGAEVSVGSDCHFYPHVTIREGCKVGNRVTIQSGAVIGSCGFGYFTDPHGKHRPLKQLGTVILEDDVDIGANTTIDRARFEATRIRRGTKIDNLVQIAHRVELGEDNLIVSQVGIAGSTKTGRHVVLGGQVGIAGHIELGDGVVLAARAAASKSLTEAGFYSGAPAMPLKEFNTLFVQQRNMSKWIGQLKALEARVHELETSLAAQRVSEETSQ